MKTRNYRRNKSLEACLQSLTGKAAQGDKKPFSAFMVIIENLLMLNSAYGHNKTDKLISDLCKKLGEDYEIHRIADSQLLLILTGTGLEKNRQRQREIKQKISQFGLNGTKTAAHIASIIDYYEVSKTTEAEKIINKLFSKTASIFSEDGEEVGQKKSRTQMALANEIYNAVGDNKLRLAFQPIIEAKSGKIHHHECLLRIIDEKGKANSAGNFIQIAEKMGIIQNIDLHVLELVAAKVKQDPKISLSFNISNLTIANPAWVKKFFEIVTPDLAKRLIVEITETAASRNLSETAYFIATLQAAGCMVALDDFGSGYTSFRQIRGLSLDYVKIDGSLIKDISNNRHNQLLVKSLVEFLHGLGLKTIAEFVDGGDTAKLLIQYGVDYMQGNYFGSAQEKLAV